MKYLRHIGLEELFDLYLGNLELRPKTDINRIDPGLNFTVKLVSFWGEESDQIFAN
jgi:hypothetical protein